MYVQNISTGLNTLIRNNFSIILHIYWILQLKCSMLFTEVNEPFASHINTKNTGKCVYAFHYSSRSKYRNVWDRQCVSSLWHLDWFGCLDELDIDIWFTFKSLTDGVCHLFNLYWLMGKGMAYGGLPFTGTGCPVPDVVNIYFIRNIWATYFYTEYMGYLLKLSPTYFLFEK